MAMVQCSNGHTYDNRVHTHCPFCPVPGLRDVNIPSTQAAPISARGVPPTEPASLRGAGSQSRGVGTQSRGGGSGDRSSTPGVTVGLFQKHIHMEPVVGWLVCVQGNNKGRDYRLHGGFNKLGREPSMDVCIEGDETISRDIHCQIAFDPRSKTFSVVPGIGRNLSYLNDQAVFSAMELKSYDRLDLGDSSFLFIPFSFDWEREKQHEQPVEQPAEPHEMRRPHHRGEEPEVL
jgi:hypothetical protein